MQFSIFRYFPSTLSFEDACSLNWLQMLFYEVYYLQFQVSAVYLFNVSAFIVWLNQA